MSLSATIFGENSLIFKATNILGLGIPGLLHKKFGPQDPEAQVQRLGELSRQTAKEGDPRPVIWGRVRPIGGNIIHCQRPKKRWVVTSTESGGGKGGSKKKQEQRTEHVYRTYAIGVCEGPITGFSRIWRNNKLVYDGRGTSWGARNNRVFLKTFRLYLGGWAQMPDPTLQSIWGAGNVPAYRGTAYMVSIDEDLTDQGGMVPQWQFEVERAEGIYHTSKLYRAGYQDALNAEPALADFEQRDVVIELPADTEHVTVTPGVTQASVIDQTQTIVDFMTVAPGIDEIYLSPPPQAFEEYVAIEPGVTEVEFSITHPADPPEFIAVEPDVTEVVLI
jgi:hypothetical protein